MLTSGLDLIRYLFVLDVTASMACLPKWPAIEMTRLLREIIADQLPMVQARPWKKRISTTPFPTPGSKNYPKTLVKDPWPIDAVILWYPAKRTYGKHEKILFELKLMGANADHGFFLEVILPAVESLAKLSPPPGGSANRLWGNVDIPSVYTAMGSHWKPLIRNGKLDLRYKVNPGQWASGIDFGAEIASPEQKCLTWVMPFSLESGNPQLKGIKKDKSGPTLQQLLNATRKRIGTVSGGRYPWEEIVTDDGGSGWDAAMTKAERNRVQSGHYEKISLWPRTKYSGYQRYIDTIAPEIMPFLHLASMFHIGEDTHYGFGTFSIG